MSYKVLLRNPDLAHRGTLPWLTLKAVLKPGDGVFTVTLPADHPMAGRVEKGGGILVTHPNGDPVFSGRFTGIKTTAADDSAARDMELTGQTDDVVAAHRVTYPDPVHAATNQDTDYWVRPKTTAETLLRELFDVNAGPSAIGARITPGVALEPDLGRGQPVTISTRFKNLATELNRISRIGGVRWTVVQSGDQLIFRVEPYEDKSRRVRFARDLGSVQGYEYAELAPETTAVFVLGQGQGAARTVINRGNNQAETEWGARIEAALDQRNTDDLAELEQAGDEALAEAAPGASLAFDTIDTPRRAFGRSYGLLDTVTVDLGGTKITDQVRQVTIEADAAQTRIRPLVGVPEAYDSQEPRWVRPLRKTISRLRDLETRR